MGRNDELRRIIKLNKQAIFLLKERKGDISKRIARCRTEIRVARRELWEREIPRAA